MIVIIKKYLTVMMVMFILAGCGKATSEEMSITEIETGSEDVTVIELDTISEETDFTEIEEEFVSDIETINVEGFNADEILDLFIDGKIMAYYTDGDREPFYMTDLPSDPEDFTYYSVGDRVDLDNDGENELIINGPYGGIYMDAREGKVYVLAEGDGTASCLSYTEFDGKTWIIHSDTTHGGRIMYDFTLYDGMGNVVDEFNFDKEFWETPDVEDGPNTVYTYRNEQITKEEYDELRMKILGY